MNVYESCMCTIKIKIGKYKSCKRCLCVVCEWGTLQTYALVYVYTLAGCQSFEGMDTATNISCLPIILGKCKALWGKPRTLLRLSQRSTELSCTRFDAERSKKSKAVDEQRCGMFFFFAWTQPTHQFDCRTSSGCRCLWGTHVGGHARTRYRVGPGLRLPMRKKENGEKRLKQLYSRSELAPS